MAGFRIFYAARIILFLGLFLVFETSEGKPDKRDDDDHECYSLINKISEHVWQVRVLTCDYGCCGTVETRYCCSEEETYGEQWRAWRIAGVVVGLAFFVMSVVIIMYCICKKKNKKRAQVSERRDNRQFTSSGISNLTSTVSSPPQPYFMHVAPVSSRMGVQDTRNEKKGIPNDDRTPYFTTELYD